MESFFGPGSGQSQGQGVSRAECHSAWQIRIESREADEKVNFNTSLKFKHCTVA
jgi:hypothetical protein